MSGDGWKPLSPYEREAYQRGLTRAIEIVEARRKHNQDGALAEDGSVARRQCYGDCCFEDGVILKLLKAERGGEGSERG